MKLVVNTYLSNTNELHPYLIESICRLRSMDYKPIVKITYNNSFQVNHICYINFLEVLRFYKDEDLLIAEDDLFINKNYEELKILLENKKGIVRCAYQHSPKSIKGKDGHFYIGTQLTFIAKDYINTLIEIMEKSKPQHLDLYFSKNKEILIEKIDSIGDEIEHYSNIAKGIRKGKIL